MSKSSRKADTPSPQRPAKTATKAAATAGQGDRVEIFVNGVRVDVVPEMEAAVLLACKNSSDLPREMTTTQAADFLDVSRPFVIKLIRRGELPCRMVGTHRRIPTAALRGYREMMFQRARGAADEMAQTSQELGLYDEARPAR